MEKARRIKLLLELNRAQGPSYARQHKNAKLCYTAASISISDNSGSPQPVKSIVNRHKTDLSAAKTFLRRLPVLFEAPLRFASVSFPFCGDVNIKQNYRGIQHKLNFASPFVIAIHSTVAMT